MCFESVQGSGQNRVTLLGAGSQYVASFDILKLGKVKYFGYLMFPLFYFFVTCDLIATPYGILIMFLSQFHVFQDFCTYPFLLFILEPFEYE